MNNEIVTASVKSNSATPKKQVRASRQKYEIANGDYSAPKPQTVQSDAMKGDSGAGAMGSPTKVAYDENGNVSVRAALNERGINDIGYNEKTGMVTVGGQDAINPAHIKDGRAFADKNTVDSITHKYYKNNGDELVGAAQYGASTGFGNLVKWDSASGVVSLGGYNIKPVYVSDDNIAYVRKSDMDKAIQQFNGQSGVKSDREIYENWANKYGTQIDAALDDIKNFSYDPNTDKEYQAYQAYQMQQKQKLAQEAAARAMDQTGGYGGANIGAIANSLFNSQQEIAQAIPQFAQEAYNRKRNNLNDTITAGDTDYNKEYTANRDAQDRVQYGLDSDWLRRKEALEMSQRQKEYKSLNYRNAIDDAMYEDNARRGAEYDQLSLEAARNAVIAAFSRVGGKWGDTAKGYGVTMPDGTFISLQDVFGTDYPSPYTEDYQSQYNSSLASGRASQQLALEKAGIY